VIANADQRKCIETIAKEGAKYVKAHLKEISKCADKNLKETGSCDFAKRDEKLDKSESKLRAALDKKCGSQSSFPNPDLTLQLLGYPGKCIDETGPPFTNDDLEECIYVTHRDIADALYDLEYGDNGEDAVLDFETQTGNADTAKLLQGCQKEIAKNAQKFVATILKEVSKCRNGLQSGSLSGFVPEDCADNPVETGPMEKIEKSESKLRDKLTDKCSDANLSLMDVCDTGGGPTTTGGPMRDCIVDTHRDASDNPNPAAPADLIDIEYRAAAVCGDNIKNDPAVGGIGNHTLARAPEECDGTDDDDCPGQCGAAGTSFPCLCEDIPRMRVVEFDEINGDNGWNGVAHDQPIVEGSGHIADLYDCDGPGGPDTVCTVGPSCTIGDGFGVHLPCVDDADCGFAGPCRKRTTAVGPHCNLNVQQACTTNANCPGFGNFCRKQLTSTPIPTSAGGVSTCTTNIFEEDIVGTQDVATGAASVRLRQKAVTHIGSVSNQPCPVCGGFCANATAEPGARSRCDDDSDCPPSVTCILDNVCSFGPNADKACRIDPPFGGTTALFGTTSVDCPPNSGADISSGGLDITTDPRTTGTATLLPDHACSAPAFGSIKKCIAGTLTGGGLQPGNSCLTDADCPLGGVGSCRFQCFCPSVGGTPQQPNGCSSACRGGSNDYDSCTADSQCPGGFCQTASCRLAQGVCVGGSASTDPCTADTDCPGGQCGDDDSNQEGFCPAGPVDGRCSITTIKSCLSDAECICPFCQMGETCVFRPRQCFVNEGIIRMGTPGLPTRIRAAAFCIPASGNPSVDSGGGFPGPGTTVGPEDVFFTGF
jgi:hypothetical protein